MKEKGERRATIEFRKHYSGYLSGLPHIAKLRAQLMQFTALDPIRELLRQYVDDPVAFRRDLRILRGRVSRVIGIDVDDAAAQNRAVDEVRLIDGKTWPVESDSIDLVVADHVLEHIQEPDGFFAEARRVLRDGGFFCARTPNRWSYFAIAAQLIPNRLHSRVLRRVQERRGEEDVFPTHYRANSRRTIRRLFRRHGMEGVVITHEAEPAYLSFSRVSYWLGTIYQRLAPGGLRSGLHCFGRGQKSPTHIHS